MSRELIEPPTAEYLSPSDELDEKTRTEFEAVRAAIRVHGQELLNIPGVLFVRVGYRFRYGKLTQQPALVVGVASKTDISHLSERSLVPRKLGSVAVDVVPATPEEILLFRQTQSAFNSTLRPQISLALPGEEAQGELEASFAPIREYVPPAEPLSPITEEMTVICHVSPDAGWRILRDFLLNTETRLTSTMYEFNARHVLDTLVAALASGGKTMSLILDAGHQDVGAGDVSKTTVRQTLEQALSGRFKFVWAAVGDDNATTAAFFKNAYHIKVSVRDGTSFWLSSGNWKRSGQPTIDPINGPFPPGFDPATFQSRSNREWHVVIQAPTLAGLFETYINHDVTQADAVQAPQPNLAGRPPLPDLFVPDTLSPNLAALAGPRFFREHVVEKELTVQPLMTPDNFIDFVLPLIEGAREKLYFQNQSLKPNSSNARYMRLFRALRDKSRDPNVDVRILVRGDFSASTILSTLQASGFEMSRVRLQNGNHNKGILIDGETTVLGSHNWTGDGTTFNRDASLIFNDSEIFDYYEEIFLYDWENLSRSDALELLDMPRIAPPGEEPPPGWARVAWADLFPE